MTSAASLVMFDSVTLLDMLIWRTMSLDDVELSLDRDVKLSVVVSMTTGEDKYYSSEP